MVPKEWLVEFQCKNASEIGQHSKQAKTFYCSNHAAMWEMIDL